MTPSYLVAPEIWSWDPQRDAVDRGPAEQLKPQISPFDGGELLWTPRKMSRQSEELEKGLENLMQDALHAIRAENQWARFC